MHLTDTSQLYVHVAAAWSPGLKWAILNELARRRINYNAAETQLAQMQIQGYNFSNTMEALRGGCCLGASRRLARAL